MRLLCGFGDREQIREEDVLTLCSRGYVLDERCTPNPQDSVQCETHILYFGLVLIKKLLLQEISKSGFDLKENSRKTFYIS